MKSTHKRLISFISAALIIAFAMPISAFVVSANDTTKKVLMVKYMSSAKRMTTRSAMKITKIGPKMSPTLGKLRIIGDSSNTTN